MAKTTFFILIIIIIFFISCDEEVISPVCDGSKPTYISEIKPIIDSNCISCHGSGSSRSNFKTYRGLKPYLDSGKFRRLVLEKQTMPRDKELSHNELNILQCWAENNYAED